MWETSGNAPSQNNAGGRNRKPLKQLMAAMDAAAKLNPDFPVLHRLRSAIALAQDIDFDTAEKEARQALRIDAEDPEALYAVAYVQCALGRWDDGLEYYRAVLSHDPLNAGRVEAYAD